MIRRPWRHRPSCGLRVDQHLDRRAVDNVDFRAYDDNAALEQIQIWDPNRGTLATWESDDYRLRQAAPDMLFLLKRINDAFYVKGSRKALLAVMKETKPLIARAEGRQP